MSIRLFLSSRPQARRVGARGLVVAVAMASVATGCSPRSFDPTRPTTASGYAEVTPRGSVAVMSEEGVSPEEAEVVFPVTVRNGLSTEIQVAEIACRTPGGFIMSGRLGRPLPAARETTVPTLAPDGVPSTALISELSAETPCGFTRVVTRTGGAYEWDGEMLSGTVLEADLGAVEEAN